MNNLEELHNAEIEVRDYRPSKTKVKSVYLHRKTPSQKVSTGAYLFGIFLFFVITFSIGILPRIFG